MIRVTVNRDGVDNGVAEPIHLEDLDTGRTSDCVEAEMLGHTRIVYRPDAPLADGTRVWIECEAIWEQKHA